MNRPSRNGLPETGARGYDAAARTFVRLSSLSCETQMLKPCTDLRQLRHVHTLTPSGNVTG